MRFVLVGFVLVVAGLLVLPPLWFRISPVDVPALPAAGTLLEVTPGARLNVVARGEGPPVVLVHGLPGTAYHWELTAAALAARGHRVLAYDRLGYGRSDPRPDDDYTVDANARELLGLLEAAALDEATVVGWSYGGKTAMTAALRDPSRMARLVLVGSAGYWADPPPHSNVVAVLTSAPVVAWVVSVPPLFRGFQRGMGEQFFSGQPAPDGFARVSAALFDQSESRRTWREESRRFRFDGPDPTAIELPVLVLHGDDDRVIPLVVAEGIAQRAPHAELVVVAGGSHALPATHPGWLADQIASFAAAH